VELADILLIAFDSPSGIPYTSIDFESRMAKGEIAASISEATTLQLEFKYLTFCTKDPKYWNAAQKIMKVVFRNNAPEGLVPLFISPQSGAFTATEIRLGSRADSYYEYLAKNWLITNQTEMKYKLEWEKSVAGIIHYYLS